VCLCEIRINLCKIIDIIWQRNQLKQELEKNQSFHRVSCVDAGDAAGNMDICGCLISVGFASGSLRARGKFQELRGLAGN
jgi:hypothetical protein